MDIESIGPGLTDPIAAEQVEIQIKYAGYIDRQLDEIAKKNKQRRHPLRAEGDFTQMKKDITENSGELLFLKCCTPM